MFELMVLVPVVSNDGIAFAAEDFTAFEAFVIDRFGGVTLYPSNVVGSWADAGRVYRDNSRVYGIAVRSLTQGGLVAEVVQYAKVAFDQKAIFIRYLTVVEIL
jgi:hypothetical protein